MIEVEFRPISTEVVRMQLEYFRIVECIRDLSDLLEDVNSRDAAMLRKMSWKYYVMLDKMQHGPREEDDDD